MAIVLVTRSLKREINKRFKKEAVIIFELFRSLKTNPKKGKLLSQVNKVAVKELKYKKFRFFFLVDAFAIKFLSMEDLEDIVIKFVRMGDKKNQQDVIDEIKRILRKMGEEGF
ncbi:hypothetical protein GOV07_01870 [Candidatus Woesearchaeota archaeon]|nr:hypothetical protein [Candidatus Woesearchaeota archaeon]